MTMKAASNLPPRTCKMCAHRGYCRRTRYAAGRPFIMSSIETVLWVEAVLALPLMLIGLSHVVQSRMWTGFFADLAARGERAPDDGREPAPHDLRISTRGRPPGGVARRGSAPGSGG